MQARISLIKIVTLLIFIPCISLAGEYYMPSPGNDLIGKNYTITVKRGDSLTSIRKKHDISYEELVDANPRINFYKLKIGQKIFIPKQFILPPKFRRGIVINIPELRLYYFTPDGRYVYTFPVGLGRSGWRTPTFAAKVIKKKEDPTWHVPESIRNYVYNKNGKLLPDAIPPGPRNPLGRHALYLSKPGYMVHGTNKPNSVGTFISSGCMRLLRKPIETLYEEIKIGTPIHVVHYPIKAGWHGNKLYLESHEPINSYRYNLPSPLNTIDVEEVIRYETQIHPNQPLPPSYINIDWNKVNKNVTEHLGIPEEIGYKYSVIR